MEPVSMLFLQALRASLEDRTVDWETDIERETWDALFAMAASHSVLPMIYAAVVRCPAARKADSQIFLPYKRQTMQAVMVQTMKTDAFLRLLPELQGRRGNARCRKGNHLPGAVPPP